MQAISRIEAHTINLPTRDIDTDQIIAARFLTTTSRDGLGEKLFYDLRFNGDGTTKPDFPLNAASAAGCEVLVAGNNFGCGSSREHAPWALLDYGFRAVISTEIADIFRSNSLKNGLLPVVVDTATHAWLLDHPASRVTIDVATNTLQLENGKTVEFPIDAFARYCLLEGIDQLGYLQQRARDIEKFEEQRQWQP